MIEIIQPTKRYGTTSTVETLTVARAGVVTGFLGPTGGGRSMAMRALTAGTALITRRDP